MNTPRDIMLYIINNKKEAAFLTAIMMCKQNFSIKEITDVVFTQDEDGYRLSSKTYNMDMKVPDESVSAALEGGRYVSAFLSRKDDAYRVHFMVHPFTPEERADREEELAKRVVRFMIYETIVALRLNTWRKVDEYIA